MSLRRTRYGSLRWAVATPLLAMLGIGTLVATPLMAQTARDWLGGIGAGLLFLAPALALLGQVPQVADRLTNPDGTFRAWAGTLLFGQLAVAFTLIAIAAAWAPSGQPTRDDLIAMVIAGIFGLIFWAGMFWSLASPGRIGAGPFGIRRGRR